MHSTSRGHSGEIGLLMVPVRSPMRSLVPLCLAGLLALPVAATAGRVYVCHENGITAFRSTACPNARDAAGVYEFQPPARRRVAEPEPLIAPPGSIVVYDEEPEDAQPEPLPGEAPVAAREAPLPGGMVVAPALPADAAVTSRTCPNGVYVVGAGCTTSFTTSTATAPTSRY